MYKKYSRYFDTFIVKFVKECNILTYFSFILYYVKITLTRKQIQCIVYFYRGEHNTCTVYVLIV